MSHREKYRHHYKLGLPALPKSVTEGKIKLEWTKHALKAAQEDGFKVDRFQELDLSRAQIIEVGMDDKDEVCKILYRTALNALHDVCFACVPFEGDHLVVKSFFVNETRDRHETINLSRYRKLA